MLESEAVAFVRAKRGIAWPNMGFRRQLEQYATRFVGNRAKDQPAERRKSKIGGGIAERIRQLKAGNHSSQTDASMVKE